VVSPTHPALELHQHQLIGAIHQAEVAHLAVAFAAMEEGEMEVITTEAAHLRIAAHYHIQAGAKTGDTAA